MRRYQIFLLIGVFLFGCSSNEPCEYANKESERYEETQLQLVMVEVEQKVENSFGHTTVQKISYMDDETSVKVGEEYGHETSMVFLIDFHHGRGDGALNPNSDYEDYQILAYQKEDGNWDIDWAGCGYG